jgi:hypothetical protein
MVLEKDTADVFRVVGFCLFLLSFFVTAIGMTPGEGFGGNVGPYSGYKCAQLSFIMSWHLPSFFGLLYSFFMPPASSWLVSPLVLLYQIVGRKIRPYVAGMTLCTMCTTLVYLVLLRFPLRAGYFLWTAGALLMLSPLLQRPIEENAVNSID